MKVYTVIFVLFPFTPFCSTRNVNPERQFDISRPDSSYYGCGATGHALTGLLDFYSVNRTAEEFEIQGFTITDRIVDLGDKLNEFRFSNATFNSIYRIPSYVVGGINAQRNVTLYMALLGIRMPYFSEPHWLCDGVLINFEWVLTAAHCFNTDLKVVRLGEYNLDTTEPSDSEDPQDYEIKRVLLYPKYKFPAAYHDIALVQLSRKTYISRPDINPVCLPWGEESKIPLVNTVVTLTGFGITSYSGPRTAIAQEVNITVFDVEKCEKGYSNLRDYQETFPEGMKSYPILCAGDEAGGKDACQGDSGGPIVYLNDVGKYTLAGIVSVGHGCGHKDFPGIYTQIAIPEYLNWIKMNAFFHDNSDLRP